MDIRSTKTKIFLDSGNPEDTKAALGILGKLDGQTTNPSLVAKNPNLAEKLSNGEKLLETELLQEYKDIVTQISQMLPASGSVSIEVYADSNTTADTMFEQGKEMATWIPNAHIKFPISFAGIEAAIRSIKEGLRVNMTLCFTQEQAAAIYSATKGATKGDVFLSPFIGRLDDKGVNGISLIQNIMKNYSEGDGHVEVLAASIRSLNHLMASFTLEADIVTLPLKVIKQWEESNLEIPDDFEYSSDLKAIEYEKLEIDKDWKLFNLTHPQTTDGIAKFAEDWNNLLKK